MLFPSLRRGNDGYVDDSFVEHNNKADDDHFLNDYNSTQSLIDVLH